MASLTCLLQNIELYIFQQKLGF